MVVAEAATKDAVESAPGREAERPVNAAEAEPSRVEAAACVGQAAAAVYAGDQFVTGLGFVLTRWVEATAMAGMPCQMTNFHSVRAPPMNIKDYLSKRIHKYFLCSDECYVLALVYMDRLGKIDPAMMVCDLNVHRVLAVALTVAAKYHDDVYYSNGYYAKVAGLSLKEVNFLEAKLLKLMRWEVYVTPEEYQLYHGLVCQATGREPPTGAPAPPAAPERAA